jgi:hypothetical protein
MSDRWDSELAAWLVGKYVLVGITTLKSDSVDEAELVQIHGIVVSTDKTKGIRIECKGTREGTFYNLPPDTAVFSPGTNNIYRLKTTNEEVDSPDAIATWEIVKPD